MVRAAIGPVIQEIDRLYGSGTSTGLDEGQLLDRFLAGGDEGAFEAIVRRHGPMVLAVCRRLLRDPNDAEDAFQATFLVLVKKAPSLRRRELLANWLYGVAFRLASRAKVDAARRRRKEAEARARAAEPSEEPAMTTADADSGPALLEEVRRLPEKYRAPVVLCYLEGRTHEEAARLLKWPVGTVKGRLARARDLLHKRLSRRGVAMPSAGVGAWLAAETAAAAVPPALVMSTVKAAAALAAGGALATGVVPGPALALAQGASRTMFLTKWTSIVGTVFAACGLATGGVAFLPGDQEGEAHQTATNGASAPSLPGAADEGEGGTAIDEAVATAEAAVADPAPEDPLLAQLVDAARKRLDFVKRSYEDGQEPIQSYIQASRTLAEAEARKARDPGDQAGAFADHAERMTTLVERTKLRESSGMVSPRELAEAEFERAWASLRRRELAGEDESGQGEDNDPVIAEETDSEVVADSPDEAMGAGAGIHDSGDAMAGVGAMMGGGRMGSGMMGVGGMGGGAMDNVGAMMGGGEMGPGSMGAAAMMPGMAMGGGASTEADPSHSSAFDEFPDAVERTAKIVDLLNAKPFSMPFDNPTPLKDVLDYIQQVTATEELPNGIPIYLDPEALAQADENGDMHISINLDSIPLRTTLWLALRQVGLAYSVIDGVLVISKPDLLAEIVLERPLFDVKQAEAHRERAQLGQMGMMGGGMR